jgi:hypothetical protein
MARWMADELGRDDGWIEAQLASFRRTAATYLP